MPKKYVYGKKREQKKDRAVTYTALANGCKFTQLYINPSNWESSKATVKKPWFIKFSYHDPERGVMEIKWRAGNKFKTLPERQDAARQLLTDTLEDLQNGLNPFTGKVAPLPTVTDPKPESEERAAVQDDDTEFMKLKGSDVNLEKQTFRREILKGLHNKDNAKETPEGVISDAALPYWRKALANCGPDNYVFSIGFRPGPKQIGPNVINRRWRKLVKPHFPYSRPYLMKHSNLTSITDQFATISLRQQPAIRQRT